MHNVTMREGGQNRYLITLLAHCELAGEGGKNRYLIPLLAHCGLAGAMLSYNYGPRNYSLSSFIQLINDLRLASQTSLGLTSQRPL